MIQKIILVTFFSFYSMVSISQNGSLNSIDDSCKMIPLLIPIKFNNKWGYCDRMKKIKIKVEFDEARPFSSINYNGNLKSNTNSYATVKKGNQFYRIDKNGDIVEPIDISNIQGDDYSFEYSPKKFELFKENNFYGIKNLLQNKVIAQPIYDSIIPFDPSLSLYFPFKVKKDGKFGVMRQDGKLIIPLKYEQLEEEGNYWLGIRLILASKNSRKYYVDYCGNEYVK
jgi:hypothetical protein